MFSPLTRPTDAYAKVGLETGVTSANPHQLVLMLFDGATFAVGIAIQSLVDGRIPEKCRMIGRALDIISGGLQASLDKEAGGELADRLDSLYEYMCIRLIFANSRNDLVALREVSFLLTEIRGAWAEIADDPAVLSANQATG
jgi:flagellar protein FliS